MPVVLAADALHGGQVGSHSPRQLQEHQAPLADYQQAVRQQKLTAWLHHHPTPAALG